jgi:integrase/recombinase XerD
MSKRKAPAGTFWRAGVLWGRVQVKGRDIKWSLHTDDPKVARQRQKEGRDRLVASAYHDDAKITFAEALVDWQPWIEKQVGARTAIRYGCSLRGLAPYLEGKLLEEVDGKLVAQIVRDRQASGKVANATIKRDLNALSSVMNFCIAQGWRDANPVLARLKMIRERRDPIALPRQEDVERLIARAPGMLAAMITAARVTGAREEELAQARCSQLDLERKRLTLVGKGNKLRVIDLVPFDGDRVFAALPVGVGNAFLFWHGQGQRYANVASRFSRLSKELAEEYKDYQRFRFHDLRHLHAVEWLRSGRSIYDLQKRLGHRSIKTTEIYLDFLTPEEQRTAKRENYM